MCVDFSMLVYRFLVYFLGFILVLVFCSYFGRKWKKGAKTEQNKHFFKLNVESWRCVTTTQFPILAQQRMGSGQNDSLDLWAKKGIPKAPVGILIHSQFILVHPASQKIKRIEGRGVLAIQASIFLHFFVIFC